MKKISADLILTNTGEPIKDGLIIFNEEDGVIHDILLSTDGVGDVQKYNGILIPGYINVHCHLELSHLKGAIPTGTGLIPFINGVMSLRDYPKEIIDEKIAVADRDMWEAGIVAVGDISNQLDTFQTKKNSRIRYYTFVEMFDLLQEEQAEESFGRYQSVYDQQVATGHHKKSMVPHAPYSVSSKLWKLLHGVHQSGETISIHNQELAAENEFSKHGTGEFVEFYKNIGMSLEHFEPSGKTSIHTIIDHLSPEVRALLVHNTMTTVEDIQSAQHAIGQTFWATCPNANLYIENKLPNYQKFLDAGAKVCIGTDSLSSNWQLSIYEEMKTIKKYQSYVPDEEIIKWATIHGAEALGYDDLGVLAAGTSPGINHIDVEVIEGRFSLDTARSSSKIA